METKHLFVFPTAILGGAERVMFNTIYYLLNRGDSVSVVIMSRGVQQGWEKLMSFPNFNFIVFDYSSEKRAIIPLVIFLMKISGKKFHTIFSSHTHINGLLSFLKKIGFFKEAILISRESTFIFERFYGLMRWIFKFIYRFMYGKQDLIICQTQRMKESLINSLGFYPAKNIESLSNPVNIDYIDNLKFENNDISYEYIVACGRLIPIKKIDFLIEAFSKLSKKFNYLNLVIIGEGPEEYKLKKIVSDLNLEARVIFTGKINNPIKWFNSAKLGVISSEIEGFPNVIIEMMASGTKNIITTPCTDGVLDLPNVFVTEECSVKSLQIAIEKILNQNIDNSIVYRKYIEDFRSVDIFWKQIEDITRK